MNISAFGILIIILTLVIALLIALIRFYPTYERDFKNDPELLAWREKPISQYTIHDVNFPKYYEGRLFIATTKKVLPALLIAIAILILLYLGGFLGI